jgi:hypothetical protein
MPRKKHSAEEIIQHLRTVEIEQANGASLEEAARKVRGLHSKCLEMFV